MTHSQVKILSDLATAKLKKIAENNNVYTEFLKFQGRIFKQNATVALEFFTQKPDVQFIATAKQWTAAGYTIKDGGTAVHFTDENGIKTDLFDYSQVEGNFAPYLWSINAENAGEFKEAFGIADNAPLIKAVIEQTVRKASVIECMEALEVPPKDFESFKDTYFGAVQTIIAGRFEVGGNNFNITPDMTAFKALDNSKQIHFLAFVSDTARTSLLKVEKIANEIKTKNLIERTEKNETNVSTMGSPITAGAEQRTGEPTSGNPTGGIGEQSAVIEDDNQGRAKVLGNPNQGTGEPENLSGIQAGERVGDTDVVQIQSDVGILQHESDGLRAVDGGRTNRELRNEVAEMDEGELPSSGRGNENETHSSDGSEVGGRESVAVQGTSRQPVPTTQSAPEDVRGNGQVGNNESILHGRSGNEGESVNPAHSGIAKLNSILEEDETSAIPEKEVGVSALPQGKGRSRKKADPNQLSLWDDEPSETVEPIETASDEPPVATVPQYVVGDTVLLEDGKSFLITEINANNGEVQLQDQSLRYPVFRAESKARFERLLKTHSGNEKFFVPVTPEVVTEVEPPSPQVKFLYEGSTLSKGEKTAHYLVYHDDDKHGAWLNHEVLAQIKEKSDNYVFYADALALSQEYMEERNISFRKLPRDWGLIDTTAQSMITAINPKHEQYWNETKEEREYADELETPEKQYDLGYADKGNGTTVYNKLEEIDGEYKTVAHISDEYDDGVKFYEDVPEDVRERIERAAYRLIHSAPPTEQELDEKLANIVTIENPELTQEYGEEKALQLQIAFNDSKFDGYQDNAIKQRVIKAVLYEILADVPETEKAFTILTGIEAIEPEIDDEPEPEVSDKLPEIAYAEKPQDKFWDNWTALRELKRVEKAVEFDRDPYDSKYNSRESSEARLSKYSGWGGLPDVFDKSKHDWSRQRSQLQEVLTEDEYEAARATTLNAHYTPQIIIDAMYEAVKNMDLPRNARILEPSCGTGNFLRRLPSQFNDAEVTGVEIDSITARIAKNLNPDVRIINNGFEHSGLDNNDYDLAISNVPFGDYQLLDPDYSNNWLIHDAFFRKALDKVAPGGVVAFVTSSGTLDKVNPRNREYLATQAELVGAIRLPNNAFKDAGTKVTADIIFLQKRKEPLQPYQESPSWCYTAPNADGLKINSYFVNNPQMVLGQMKQTTHFDMLSCEPFEGAVLKEQLNQAILNLNVKITTERRNKALKERSTMIDADSSVKNFTFGKVDGKFYYRTGDKMEAQNLKPAEFMQLEALCNLRVKMRELLDKQKTHISDEALMPIRAELNKQYDDYHAKHGVLNSAAMRKLFGDDADFPLLQSLEEQNEETKKYNKADIFFKRTVNAVKEITGAANVEEALQISLDKRGKPNIHYMAELLERETDSVCKELLEKELAFRDPDKLIPDVLYSDIIERSEYLSGNVRRKLQIAEANMLTHVDSQTGKLDGTDYKRNVEALQKVIPEDIKAENISVRMGVPWIDGSDYTKFLKHLAGRNGYASNGEVTYSPATGEFEVSGAKKRNNDGLNPNESTKYGTGDFSLYALAEKSLNQRQIVVKYEVPHPDDPSKTITRTNSKATKKALEKARIIKEEFKKWIFNDPARCAKYERKYNDIFNCLVGREYDGTKLTFTGLKSDFQMRDHQKNAIARASMGGNTLVAHVVGAGKSAVIFASVMRKKELGLINKACIVVPKALTEQIAKEWRNLYPDARLLTVTNDDLSNENKRKLFTAKVATGTYDSVILSREQFEKIPMSLESRIAFMRKELDQVEDMLRERKRANHGKGDPSTKQLELAKKRMMVRISKLTDPKAASKAKDDLLEFEQLGFDYLVADEAHSYKNGFVMTKMTNVAGVTTKESGRAADMQMKCDYFNEQLGNGHILMATGTPVSNSMTELFVMTRYLRPDLLRQAGVSRFDDWAATFGNVTTQLEQTAYNTYKLKTRFSEFANLPELMAFYKEFADIKSAAKLELPRPNLKNGKNTIVKVEATPEQKAYVKELGERAEAINAGSVSPHEDNFLKITGEARLIGLGNQAVKAMYARRGEELPAEFVEEDQKNGKVDACVEKVFERWNETTEVKGVQLVFSDIAVNDDNDNFSAYKYIKQELIDKGIPEEEIIFAPKSDSNVLYCKGYSRDTTNITHATPLFATLSANIA